MTLFGHISIPGLIGVSDKIAPQIPKPDRHGFGAQPAAD
jgi:hypothetical protein